MAPKQAEEDVYPMTIALQKSSETSDDTENGTGGGENVVGTGNDRGNGAVVALGRSNLALRAVARRSGLGGGRSGGRALGTGASLVVDNLALALITVALLDVAGGTVADNLAVLASGVLALVTLADDEAVVVGGVAVLDPAVAITADNTVSRAGIAGVLGEALVTVADNLLVVGGGLRAEGRGDGVDSNGLAADGAVGDLRRARGDGTNGGGGLSDGSGGVRLTLTDVDSQENVGRNVLALAEEDEATALLVRVTRAVNVARVEINTVGLGIVDLSTTVAVGVMDTHVLGVARSGAEVKIHLGHHADTAEGRESVVRADAAVETELLAETAGETVDAASVVGVGAVVGALSSDDVGRSQGEEGVHAHLDGVV